MVTETKNIELAIEEYKATEEPYYLPVGREVELFEAAYQTKLPPFKFCSKGHQTLI